MREAWRFIELAAIGAMLAVYLFVQILANWRLADESKKRSETILIATIGLLVLQGLILRIVLDRPSGAIVVLGWVLTCAFAARRLARLMRSEGLEFGWLKADS